MAYDSKTMTTIFIKVIILFIIGNESLMLFLYIEEYVEYNQM